MEISHILGGKTGIVRILVFLGGGESLCEKSELLVTMSPYYQQDNYL